MSRGTAAAPGSHVWVVIVIARPQDDGAAQRELLRALREQGARRISAGVLLVPDAEGMSERLQCLVDRIAHAGGRVIIASSVIVDGRERQ